MENETMDFTEFLLQMKIPEVNDEVCEILNNSFKGKLPEFLSTAQMKFNFALLEGISQETSGNIHNWFGKKNNIRKWKEEYNNIFVAQAEITPSSSDFSSSESRINGKRIVITGTMPGYTRADIVAKITKLGGTVDNKVRGYTDYLVAADTSKDTVKRKDAIRFGIKIISASDFLSWL